MTDEEKAVNWIRSQGWSEENLPSDEFGQMSQAYLAGLKAGKDIHVPTKWHKVVDGDLPKENNLYLVAIKDNGLAIAYFNGLHWETKFNLGDFGHCLETVIAWCEIPKFEEK